MFGTKQAVRKEEKSAELIDSVEKFYEEFWTKIGLADVPEANKNPFKVLLDAEAEYPETDCTVLKDGTVRNDCTAVYNPVRDEVSTMAKQQVDLSKPIGDLPLPWYSKSFKNARWEKVAAKFQQKLKALVETHAKELDELEGKLTEEEFDKKVDEFASKEAKLVGYINDAESMVYSKAALDALNWYGLYAHPEELENYHDALKVVEELQETVASYNEAINLPESSDLKKLIFMDLRDLLSDEETLAVHEATEYGDYLSSLIALRERDRVAPLKVLRWNADIPSEFEGSRIAGVGKDHADIKKPDAIEDDVLSILEGWNMEISWPQPDGERRIEERKVTEVDDIGGGMIRLKFDPEDDWENDGQWQWTKVIGRPDPQFPDGLSWILYTDAPTIETLKNELNEELMECLGDASFRVTEETMKVMTLPKYQFDVDDNDMGEDDADEGKKGNAKIEKEMQAISQRVADEIAAFKKELGNYDEGEQSIEIVDTNKKASARSKRLNMKQLKLVDANGNAISEKELRSAIGSKKKCSEFFQSFDDAIREQEQILFTGRNLLSEAQVKMIEDVKYAELESKINVEKYFNKLRDEAFEPLYKFHMDTLVTNWYRDYAEILVRLSTTKAPKTKKTRKAKKESTGSESFDIADVVDEESEESLFACEEFFVLLKEKDPELFEALKDSVQDHKRLNKLWKEYASKAMRPPRERKASPKTSPIKTTAAPTVVTATTIVPSEDVLGKYTVKDLKRLAKLNEQTGYSKMKKDELISMLTSLPSITMEGGKRKRRLSSRKPRKHKRRLSPRKKSG